MSILVIGCSNKEEKTAANQNGNQVNTEQKSAGNDVNQQQGQADQNNQQKTDNQAENNGASSQQGQSGGEENMPSFTVNVKPGMVPQQRLVEVKVDTDTPDKYYVAVNTKVLEYRESVDLFVGLIDSNDEDAIKKSVQVFKKSS